MTARSASRPRRRIAATPPASCDDDERWALASVLGELGTGVFQVAGGAPGGTKQTRAVARELAARTGRPSIYNLMSRSDRQPRRVGRAPALARGRVQERRALLRLVPLDRRRRDLQSAARPQRAAGRGHHPSRGLLPRHADLGQGHGAALSGPDARLPRPGNPQGDVGRGGRGHGRAAGRHDRPARPRARPRSTGAGTSSRCS